MCPFKPGDEVVCVHATNFHDDPCVVGSTYRVAAVRSFPGGQGLDLKGIPVEGCLWLGHAPGRFRKVNRRNSRLTIEAFMTMPGGFEEPKRKSPTPTRKEKA